MEQRDRSKVNFYLNHRKNSFKKGGMEWALNVSIGGSSAWTLLTWDEKPPAEYVNEIREAVVRGMEVYHVCQKSLYPQFQLIHGDFIEDKEDN